MRLHNVFLTAWIALSVASMTAVNAWAGAAQPPRPKLQIINGSSGTIDLFWLKNNSERVPSGSVEPGHDTVIDTSIGHRFEIVSRADKATATVTSQVPVQGFRFDPNGRDGIPAFYTQRVSAKGFPIVASSKVDPHALQELSLIHI